MSDIVHLSEVLSSSAITDLAVVLPEHAPMVEKIKETLPEIQRASSFFYKTQSQFMDNMLTVSHYTPLRNARQILAEINKAKAALKEAHFKLKKKEIEFKMKKRDLACEKDDLNAEMLYVEIAEIESQMNDSSQYISGAVRKISNYIDQYKSILQSHDLENFNEEDFEKDEEAYHIMRAFDQGICAARTHGGSIDEGNMIYLTQIGINGTSAQNEVFKYLKSEGKMIAEGIEPPHSHLVDFLHNMAKKYAGCSVKHAKAKGMTGTFSDTALLKQGDTRLLETRQNSDE